MEIANPIYDAAFKYLMQDDRAARLLVGRITGLDVESLELRPQEAAAVPRPPNGRSPRTVTPPPRPTGCPPPAGPRLAAWQTRGLADELPSR